MSALLVQQRSPAPGPSRPPWRRWLDRLVEGPRAVVLIALAAGVIWLPTLARPMSSDEGGFLLVASQWSPGRSLYGSYWVDRPPLLIALFQLADLGGGLVALRLLGLAAVVTSVLVSGRIGALAAPSVRWAPALAAATCGAFVTTPLFGAGEVDGELLAVPFLLASILSVLVALGSAPQRDGWLRGAGPWWTLAGASAMTAVLVKQSMLDGFVLAAAVVVWLLVRTGRGETMRAVAAYTLGAGGLLGSVLLWASSRGTAPVDLWRAVVVFRADAAAVISTEASASTPARAETLVISFLTSGALAVILLALLPRIHRWRWASAPRDHASRPDLRLLAGVVLAWEAVAVASGGSYWLHYLIGLVPGLVLASAAVATHQPARSRWVAAGLGYAVVAGLVSAGGIALNEPSDAPSIAVEHFLEAHARPGDTGVVAFGDPAILESADLSSPYPQLWSLPVRVLDPHLEAFTAVIAGPDRPTWAVVDGSSLATWGVDAAGAQPVFDREYRLVDVEGDYQVFRLRGALES